MQPESSIPPPLLSIVVTTRNDDHGGNMLHRFQIFLDHLGEVCDRHGLNAELIVVEWNPDPNFGPLYEAMRWPKSRYLRIRGVIVPASIHNAYSNADVLPLFQMIAKNVGVRRARGEYVLATNIDILFSEELATWLAGNALNPNAFYRIDRTDISATSIPQGLNVTARLAFCKKHVAWVHGQHGSHPPNAPSKGDPQALHTNACGDFILMARQSWLDLKGYPEFPLWAIYLDGLLLYAAQAIGMSQVVLQPPLRVYHIEHGSGWSAHRDIVKKVPYLDYDTQYKPLCQWMLKEGKPLDFNRPGWGLADVPLEEWTPPRPEGIAKDQFSPPHTTKPHTRHPGLTLFAAPKTFLGHVADIQENAIESWTRLSPRPEIILFGDEPSVAAIAARLGLRHAPVPGRDDHGLPCVGALFDAAGELATNDIVAYVSADLILFDDFPAAVGNIRGRTPEFLMVGRRVDYTLIGRIDFSLRDWDTRLRQEIKANGMLHAGDALDYFIFTPGLWPKIPSLALGSASWKRWLLNDAHNQKKTVVDATAAICAIHQSHACNREAGGENGGYAAREVCHGQAAPGINDGHDLVGKADWALGPDGKVTAPPLSVPTGDDPAYPQKRANWLLRQAKRLIAANQLDIALANLDEALALVPDKSNVLPLIELLLAQKRD